MTGMKNKFRCNSYNVHNNLSSFRAKRKILIEILRKYWIEIRPYTFIEFSTIFILRLSRPDSAIGNVKRTYLKLENKSLCLLTHFFSEEKWRVGYRTIWTNN